MVGEGGCEGGFDVGGFGVFIVIGNVVAAGDDGEFFVFVGVDDIFGVVVFANAMSDVSADEDGDSQAESFVEQFLHLA